MNPYFGCKETSNENCLECNDISDFNKCNKCLDGFKLDEFWNSEKYKLKNKFIIYNGNKIYTCLIILFHTLQIKM